VVALLLGGLVGWLRVTAASVDLSSTFLQVRFDGSVKIRRVADWCVFYIPRLRVTFQPPSPDNRFLKDAPWEADIHLGWVGIIVHGQKQYHSLHATLDAASPRTQIRNVLFIEPMALIDAATSVGFFVEDERQIPQGHRAWLTNSRANLISQQCDANGERCESVWRQPVPGEHCSPEKIDNLGHFSGR
jgi:hypothetical protein